MKACRDEHSSLRTPKTHHWRALRVGSLDGIAIYQSVTT